LRPTVRSGLFSVPLLVVPVVFASCTSGAATCAANTNVTVSGGTVSYTPQTSALQSLGVTTSAVSPATSSNGAFHLPISGGSVNNSSLSGTIKTNGGIKFSGPGGRSVSLTDFSINTQSGLVSANANGQAVQFLQVRLSTASKSTSSNQANLSGVTSTLASTGAVVLNRDLAITTFTPGYQLGTFTAGVTYSCS
jgi:hypothetical protein